MLGSLYIRVSHGQSSFKGLVVISNVQVPTPVRCDYHIELLRSGQWNFFLDIFLSFLKKRVGR